MAGNDIARVYATSLLEIGQEKKSLSQLGEELGFVSDVLTEDTDFKKYLTSPGFSMESKKGFIEKVFSGKLSDDTVNFLNVLIDNGRQSAIPEIFQAFNDLIDDENNRIRVEVISTTKLDAATLDKIKDALGSKYSKEVILTESLDANIIGGIIIKVGDLVIDGSLVNNLKKLRSNLLNSKVRSEVAYED